MGRAAVPYLPAYSASTPRPPSTPSRADGPAHHRPGDRLPPRTPGSFFPHQGQTQSRPGRPRDHVVGAGRPSGAGCPCTAHSPAPAMCRRGATSGPRTPRSPDGEDPGGHHAGFPRIKLKFRPGWDSKWSSRPLPFPDFTFPHRLHAPTRRRIPSSFRKLDRYHLAMIEQPLADRPVSLINHADCRSASRRPCARRERRSAWPMSRRRSVLGSCKSSTSRWPASGGLTASRDIQPLCRARNPCWIGACSRAPSGGAICARSSATLPNFT